MNSDIPVKKLVIGVGLFLLGLFLLVSVSYGVRIIQPGFVGVCVRLGAAQKEGLGEGVHVVMPWISYVYPVDTRIQRYEVKSDAASKDLQTVTVTVVVNYHLQQEKVVDLYRQVGLEYSEVVIHPAIQEVYKACAAEFNAEELITKRQMVSDRISDLLSKRLLPVGIAVDQINLVNFDFSRDFNQAIEQKVMAEQNALKEQNNLKMVEFQAQQTEAQAKGQANAKLAMAEAEAKSLQLRAAATTPLVMMLNAIEKWDGKMPQTLLLDGKNGLTPIFDVSKATAAEAVKATKTKK